MSTIAPVESSAAGAKPAVAQRGQHLGDRRLRHRDGRCQQPHVESLGGGRGDRLGQQRGILAADERRRHADPQLSVPARDVVDQVGQVLAAQVFSSACAKKACSSPAVRPVSRACRIDCSLTRYTIAAPADSTVATAASSLGEVALAAGRAPRPSGRPAAGSGRSARAAPWPSRRRRASSASPASSARAGVLMRAAADDAERVRLGEQVARPVRAAAGPPSAAAARSSPATPSVASTPGAGRQVGEQRQQQPAVQRCRGRVQRIRQCRIGFAVRSAAADQAGPCRQVQPGRRRAGASARRWAIRRTGRRPPSAPSTVPSPSVRFGVGHARWRSVRPPRRPRGSARAAARRYR